jgi:DNA-binding CsgD family transcriptional regulator
MATLAPSSRLRGRTVELRTLADALGRAAGGRPAIVVVEGEAGIGKSRLLAEALEAARSRGLEVVAGRGQDLERNRPFGLLADAFGCSRSSPDPRRAAIAALLATHDGDRGVTTVSSDPGLQFQAVDAFLDLVEALAGRGPLVLGLDDLQWADPSSLLTLGALARRLTVGPVALVASLRPLPGGRELERMLEAFDAAGARRLALGQLDREAVAGLVAEAVAAEPGPRLMAEVAAAGGNPLFVTELVAALLSEGAVRTVDGRAEVVETTLPPNLRLTILRRLSFLPEETLEALRPASILGSSFSLTELSATTGRSALELSSVLAEAIRAKVLEDDGERLRFRHDLIHEAIYEDLPASVRLALHREAGRRLAGAGAEPLRVAEHLARAATQGDAEAVAWLTRAARDAAPRSHAAAAEMLGRAIALADPADPGRERLLVERAGALMWSGRLAEAEAAFRSLLGRGHDPSVEAQARILLARTLATQVRIREALQELECVQQSPGLAGKPRAAAWVAEAMARVELGDLDGAVAAVERARTTAAGLGGHPAISLALTSLAIVEELRADLARALELIDEAVRLADRSDQRHGHRNPIHLIRGCILMDLDRFEEARSTLQTGRRISEELGVRWRLPFYQAVLAMERFLAGDWDDALADLEEALTLTEETGERYSLVLSHAVKALIALHRGELRQAEAAVATAEAELADTGPRFRSHWATWARALVLEAQGKTGQAFATLAGCWDRCAAFGMAVELPLFGADLARLALAAGDRGRAEQVAAAVAQVAAGNQVASLTGAARRCQGLTTDNPEVLRSAVDAYAASGRPLELAQTTEDTGAALARHGQVAAATPLLHQALDSYEHLDAARGAARVEARLRELGVRRGRRGPRQRPQLGWPSLTPTEHRVVDLVAEGLSNPQIGRRLFVSSRTVQTHLAHVFTKLGISSRAQLAAEATRRREAPRRSPGG